MRNLSLMHELERRYRNQLTIVKRLLYFLLLVFAGQIDRSTGQTYEDVLSLYRDKMNSDNYSIDARPVSNQSQTIHVHVSFELLTIIELDDVSQSFNCNGFVLFFWTDQVLAWNPEDYGGQTSIHPRAANIWRPRVILANTIENRDIFAEDNAPVVVFHNGSTGWFPGSTFPTSCALNMTKYPFDEQFCRIQLVSMGHTVGEVQFIPLTREAGDSYYIKNGIWNVVSSSIEVFNMTDGFTGILSCIMITFHLKRNPVGILINILLPVVFLAFLNLWVFVIPVESGEKIGYGTTVLMALSVFMTTMSSMLPVSSDTLPSVVIYIFILLIISLLTVITSIIIVFLHHKEEKEAQYLQAQANLKKMMNKITLVRKAVCVIDNRNSNKINDNKVHPMTPDTEEEDDLPPSLANNKQEQCVLGHNKYKVIGKYIDLISLIIFFAAWLCITIGFLLEVSR